tara:strand:+ start:6125 stop:7027 length:903 start_codon:yes stop_codon:yes gene_type:complete
MKHLHVGTFGTSILMLFTEFTSNKQGTTGRETVAVIQRCKGENKRIRSYCANIYIDENTTGENTWFVNAEFLTEKETNMFRRFDEVEKVVFYRNAREALKAAKAWTLAKLNEPTPEPTEPKESDAYWSVEAQAKRAEQDEQAEQAEQAEQDEQAEQAELTDWNAYSPEELAQALNFACSIISEQQGYRCDPENLIIRMNKINAELRAQKEAESAEPFCILIKAARYDFRDSIRGHDVVEKILFPTIEKAFAARDNINDEDLNENTIVSVACSRTHKQQNRPTIARREVLSAMFDLDSIPF